MTGTPISDKSKELLCEAPEEMHRLCAESLDKFANGEATVHTPAYICNMVDSSLIPLTECLIRTYADGVLLNPFVLW